MKYYTSKHRQKYGYSFSFLSIKIWILSFFYHFFFGKENMDTLFCQTNMDTWITS